VPDEQLPCACENADGSLDIWARGHRLHFPGDGRKPTITKEATAPAEADALPADVLTDLADAMTTISYDGWFVRFSPSTTDINRTKAHRRPGRKLFYGRFGSGDG
jgi:hypothetical protein